MRLEVLLANVLGDQFSQIGLRYVLFPDAELDSCAVDSWPEIGDYGADQVGAPFGAASVSDDPDVSTRLLPAEKCRDLVALTDC